MKTSGIHVLVVDDSAVVRQALREILLSDPGIVDVRTASDPFDAVNKLQQGIPDVITLDVEMPRMDGITFLNKIMSQKPIPVVMCSSLTEKGCETTLQALELGAIDIITKPKLGVKDFIEESKIRICDTVKAAAGAKTGKTDMIKRNLNKKMSADVMLSFHRRKSMIRTTEKIVVIGASTGGTEAIRVFLQSLPVDSPGIVIVQHMPENFTRAFAKRLDSICAIEVKEAEDNDTILRGRAIIAQGNRHCLIKRSGSRYYVQVKEGPLVSRHRPSVDVLFRSAAEFAGNNSIGIIMTGMGDDGACGLMEMKENGAYTIAQDEKTSIIYGMPAEAVKRGAVDIILPLEKIAVEMLRKAESPSERRLEA